MSKIFWKSITRDIFIVAVGVALGVIGTIVSTKYMMPKLSVEVSWKSYIFGMENTSNKTNTDIPEKGYNWDLTKSKGEFLIFQDLENLPIEKVDPFVRILSQDESIRNFPPHICYIFKALIKNLGELTADEIELGIFVPSDAEAYISVCSNVRWKVLQDGKKGLKIIRIDRLVPKQVAVLTVYFNIYGFSLEVAEEFKKIFTKNKQRNVIRNTIYSISSQFCEILFLSCKQNMGIVNRNIASMSDILEHEVQSSGDIDFPPHEKFKPPKFFL